MNRAGSTLAPRNDRRGFHSSDGPILTKPAVDMRETAHRPRQRSLAFKRLRGPLAPKVEIDKPPRRRSAASVGELVVTQRATGEG